MLSPILFSPSGKLKVNIFVSCEISLTSTNLAWKLFTPFLPPFIVRKMSKIARMAISPKMNSYMKCYRWVAKLQYWCTSTEKPSLSTIKPSASTQIGLITFSTLNRYYMLINYHLRESSIITSYHIESLPFVSIKYGQLSDVLQNNKIVCNQISVLPISSAALMDSPCRSSLGCAVRRTKAFRSSNHPFSPHIITIKITLLLPLKA